MLFGFDALIIGFLVTSSIKIRSSILEKKEPPSGNELEIRACLIGM